MQKRTFSQYQNFSEEYLLQDHWNCKSMATSIITQRKIEYDSSQQSDSNGDSVDSNVSSLLNESELIKTDELRVGRRWKPTCDKGSIKICENACTDAYKHGCEVYKCTSRLEGKLRKQCRYTCIGLFKIRFRFQREHY